MDYNSIVQNSNVEFGQMPPGTFLIGLLSAFENCFQTVADSFFEEITWKQFFAIICINLCKDNPTINELSDIMASSHQNVKQILLKLEKNNREKNLGETSTKVQNDIFIKYCQFH